MKTPSKALGPAEAEVLAAAAPALAAIAVALRHQVLALHPDATILAWPRQHIISFGVGVQKMKDHYAFIALHASHVNLGLYRGAALAERGFELEGTGKSLRHLRVGTTEEAGSERIRQLLLAAHRLQVQGLAEGA